MQPRVFKAKPHGACLRSQIGLILFSSALPDGWDSVQGVGGSAAGQSSTSCKCSVSYTSCLAPCGGTAVVPVQDEVKGTWPANKAVGLPALSVRWF